ncbi:MAG TPA: hypothetical protein VJM34_05750 [Novosphingobium sp.]|nr:hypothetical protein [Novosphingobium sp.]
MDQPRPGPSEANPGVLVQLMKRMMDVVRATFRKDQARQNCALAFGLGSKTGRVIKRKDRFSDVAVTLLPLQLIRTGHPT